MSSSAFGRFLCSAAIVGLGIIAGVRHGLDAFLPENEDLKSGRVNAVSMIPRVEKYGAYVRFSRNVFTFCTNFLR